MTVHATPTMTKEAFLAWVEHREERYEYAGGRVIMMVRVTWNHAVVTTSLVAALISRIDRDTHDVASEAFAVDVGGSLRFPDVLVQSIPADGRALAAATPILIAEVLSPGTFHIDFGDKRQEYLALPSLETYVIASADEPRLWVWQRTEGQFPSEPEVSEGLD